MMELRLSCNSPINTDLLDAKGKAFYTISTPYKVSRRTTTIYRYLLDSDGQPTDAKQELARIHWHHWRSSRLVYNGQILEIGTFMPKNNMLGLTRSFTGPDGKSYTWRISWLTCQLELADGSQPPTVVAKMRQGLQNIFTGTKPTLEIEEGALHLLDLIIVTWIFVERRRRETNTA